MSSEDTGVGMEESISWSILKDWWAFAAFVGGGVVAFFLGQERRRYKIEDLAQKFERFEIELESLKNQGRQEAVSVAEVRVQLTMILAAVTELREELRGKADKD